MRTLNVSIEVMGEQVPVGMIRGETHVDARFTYDRDYLDIEGAAGISLNLPLREEPFDALTTRVFFDGLLPEGFTRRSVAGYLNAVEEDYLTILAALGNECLGAIRITEGENPITPPRYKKIGISRIKELAAEGAEDSARLITESRLSLAGASGKVGLYLDEKKGSWYLPIGDAPSTHIVKQSHVRFSNIVTNEQLVLLTARKVGIEVPESFVINTGDAQDREVLFASKRYDREEMSPRKVNGHACPYRRHQEDLAQALGIPSAYKYEPAGKSYFRQVGHLILSASKNPLEDIAKLWDITIFNWLVGNTDNHIKNLSVLYSKDLKTISLAPAYDLLSTAIYSASSRNMGFNIGGKSDLGEIDIASWKRAAVEIGLGAGFAMDRLDQMIYGLPDALKASAEELAALGFKQAKEIAKRIQKTAPLK